MITNMKRNWLAVSKLTQGVWRILTQAKYFWLKYIMIELEKHRWLEEFGKFSSEHLKVSKLGLLWGTFIQIKKFMRLNFTGELCVMAMKNDAKCEEELTCRFKIDMWNLMNFDLSTQKSQ